jgi:putative phage-type endonuclease
MAEPKIIDCVQGTPEWFAARRGRITSSRIDDVMAQNKKGDGYGITRRKYLIQLAGEIITRESTESYTNSAMQRGVEIEPIAREYYENLTGRKVEQVGFFQLGEFEGSSPDGLIDDDGDIEIKCPMATTHIENILSNTVPSEYISQIQHQLYVSGRKWCDFMSFHPAFKEKPAVIIRVFRDETLIEKMKKESEIFINDLKELITKINHQEF